MANLQDPGLNARLDDLGEVSWNKSLLQNTRCPFLRAAAAAGELSIENGNNVQSKPVLVATVDSVKKAGRDLDGVLAFFARFNHTRGLHRGQDTQLGGLTQSTFNLDQSTDNNTSDGTHDGTVDIIHGATGLFNAAVVAKIREIVGNSAVLTPQSIAQVIIASNRGAFSDVSGNSKGKILDLAKSAGEWALMFCLLEDPEGNVPIADLEALCRDARVPQGGWDNLGSSGTREWVHYTSAITAHIAHGKHDSTAEVVDAMHATWSEENSGPGCGCIKCMREEAAFWQNARQSVRDAIAGLGGSLGRWFGF